MPNSIFYAYASDSMVSLNHPVNINKMFVYSDFLIKFDQTKMFLIKNVKRIIKFLFI